MSFEHDDIDLVARATLRIVDDAVTDGGGYTTQIVLVAKSAGASSRTYSRR